MKIGIFYNVITGHFYQESMEKNSEDSEDEEAMEVDCTKCTKSVFRKNHKENIWILIYMISKF